MSAPIPDDEIINELELTILGRRDWVERARAGKIKRSPEAIDMAARRLTTLDAALVRFRELVETRRAE